MAEMVFLAVQVPNPPSGVPSRHYVLDCPHAVSEITVPDRADDSRDAEVLGYLVRTVKEQSAREGRICDCGVKGWRRRA